VDCAKKLPSSLEYFFAQYAKWPRPFVVFYLQDWMAIGTIAECAMNPDFPKACFEGFSEIKKTCEFAQ